MAKPTRDEMKQVLGALIALLLFIAIGVAALKLLAMTPEILAAPDAETALRREAVATGILVPLLQTLIVGLLGTAFIKGALTITDNYFRALNKQPLAPIRFFSW